MIDDRLDGVLGVRIDLDPVDRLRARAAVMQRMFGGPAVAVTAGRFEVRRTLGFGAMGRVYLAYDPDLQRLVALKFVTLSEAADERLRREARVLARLSHPNVVTVFDVGHVRGRRFVAMEYVEGQNLREWLEQTGPSSDAIIAVFARVADGLAAAHGVGVIHRDIKPENILRGHDGRVTVADFGLATTLSTERAGTPVYFAPELAEGAAADPRSDQYAFFVTLHEALTGHRPPPGAVIKSGAGIPPNLVAVVRRGLRRDPRRRFASMHAVQRALMATRTTPWRALGLGGLATTLLVGGLWWGQSVAPSCEEQARHRMAAVWSDGPRAQLERAFVFAGVSTAVVSHATHELDRAATGWIETYAATCRLGSAAPRATAICLDASRSDQQAAISTLLEGPRQALQDAPMILAAMRGAAPCREATAVDEPPADVAQALSRSRVLAAAGRFGASLDSLARVQTDTLPRTVAADVAYERGRALVGAGEVAAGAKALEAATLYAVAADNDTAALRAAIELVSVWGYELMRADEARRWDREAQTFLSRLGRPPRLLAELEIARGLTALAASEFQASVEHYREAERAFARLDTTAIDRAGLQARFATVFIELGDYDAALMHLGRAESERIAIFGEAHAMVAETRANRAAILRALGRGPEAIAAYQTSVRAFELALGPEHPALAAVQQNLGNALADEQRYPEAMVWFRRALAMVRATLGDVHPQVATVLANGATVLRHLDERTQARAWAEESLRIRQQVLGPDHLDLAYSYVTLGDLAADEGESVRASTLLARAQTMFEAELGHEHPTTQAVANKSRRLSGLPQDPRRVSPR